MKTIDTSKLALGTVQFGLDYGISNTGGRTAADEVTRIIAFAEKQGIGTLDTAHAYGDSERILGEQNLQNWKIISKFPAVAGRSLNTIFDESLNRLHVDQLYGYLAHNATLLLENPKLWTDLQKLKTDGKVQKIGYSLYSPAELDRLMQLGMVPDLVQIPFNILDTRFEDRLSALKANGVEIHSRSSFLQGLFFINPKKLPASFDPVVPYLQDLHHQFPNPAERAALLLNFCVSRKNIDKVVIGVNTAEQLQSNLRSFDSTTEIPFPERENINENILNPSKWPK